MASMESMGRRGGCRCGSPASGNCASRTTPVCGSTMAGTGSRRRASSEIAPCTSPRRCSPATARATSVAMRPASSIPMPPDRSSSSASVASDRSSQRMKRWASAFSMEIVRESSGEAAACARVVRRTMPVHTSRRLHEGRSSSRSCSRRPSCSSRTRNRRPSPSASIRSMSRNDPMKNGPRSPRASRRACQVESTPRPASHFAASAATDARHSPLKRRRSPGSTSRLSATRPQNVARSGRFIDGTESRARRRMQVSTLPGAALHPPSPPRL